MNAKPQSMQLLKEIRSELKLTKSKMSRELNMTRQGYGQLESGGEYLSMKQIKRLRELIGDKRFTELLRRFPD